MSKRKTPPNQLENRMSKVRPPPNHRERRMSKMTPPPNHPENICTRTTTNVAAKKTLQRTWKKYLAENRKRMWRTSRNVNSAPISLS